MDVTEVLNQFNKEQIQDEFCECAMMLVRSLKEDFFVPYFIDLIPKDQLTSKNLIKFFNPQDTIDKFLSKYLDEILDKVFYMLDIDFSGSKKEFFDKLDYDNIFNQLSKDIKDFLNRQRTNIENTLIKNNYIKQESTSVEKIKDLHDEIGDVTRINEKLDLNNRDYPFVDIDGEVLVGHSGDSHANVIQQYINQFSDDKLDDNRVRPDDKEVKKILKNEYSAYGHIIDNNIFIDMATLHDVSFDQVISDIKNSDLTYNKIYKYDGKQISRFAKNNEGDLMDLAWNTIDEAKEYLTDEQLKEWAKSIYIFDEQQIKDYLTMTYPVSDWEMDKNSESYNELKQLTLNDYMDAYDPGDFGDDYKHNLGEFIKDGDFIDDVDCDDMAYDLFEIALSDSNLEKTFDDEVQDYIVNAEHLPGFNTDGEFDARSEIEDSAEESVDDVGELIDLDDSVGDVIDISKRIDYNNRDYAIIYLDGEIFESDADESHGQILQKILEDEGREDEVPQNIIDKPKDGSRPSLNRMKRLTGTEEVAFGHVVNDCAFIEELENGATIDEVSKACKNDYSKVYQYDGGNMVVKRVAKQAALSIKPNDSSYEDFVLSLSDYFCKEFNNRGLCAKRNQGYVSIPLPQLYKEKYHSVIVDCGNGYVYLRGDNCNDKKFGKLSKYNPQRKSDAYNCVNYNVTRLVNRINNLDYGICDLRVANLVTAEEIIDLVPDAIPEILELEENQEEPEVLTLDDIPEDAIVIDLPIDLDEIPDDAFLLIIEEPIETPGIDLTQLDSDYTLDKVSPDDFLEINASVDDDKLNKLYEEHPNLKEKDFGEIEHIYKDSFTAKTPYEFSDKDVEKWCILWNNVIEKRFCDAYGINKADIELDDNVITLWVGNLYNCELSQNYQNPEYEGVPGKIFFNVAITGYMNSNYDFEGNLNNQDEHPLENGIHFEYAGEKL